MLYSTEYEVEVLEEGKKPTKKVEKEFGFDKFMTDILIREGKEVTEEVDEEKVAEKKRLIAEGQEHERRRQEWRRRYHDSPYSRMRVKK